VRISLESLIFALVLAGCGRPEAKVDRSLAGNWVLEWVAPDGAQVETKDTFGTDGHWTCHNTFTLSNQVTTDEAQGTVEIKDGFLIRTVTNSSDRSGAPLPWTSRSLIVRTNDHELVLKQDDTEFIHRRQM
jgi:hypothetical protein